MRLCAGAIAPIGIDVGDAKFCLAPAVGFEPTTNRLTADRSTTELRWIAGFSSRVYILPCDSAESTLDRLIPTASGLYH